MGFVRKVGRAIDDTFIQPVVKTVEAVLDDPKKLLAVGLSVFAPGIGTALGSAMGLSGTVATLVGNAAVNTALNGGDIKAGIIAAAIPVVGKEIAGSAATAFMDSGMDKALAESAGKVVAGTGIAAVQGKDPLSALISGGLSEGTAAITRDIPGFSDLPEAAKKSINAAVATELAGGDGTQSAINAAMNVGINTLTNYTNSLNPDTSSPNKEDFIEGYFKPGGEGYIEKEVTNPLGPTEEFNPEETDWASFYKNVGGEGVDESNLSNLSPEDRAKYDAMKAGDTSSIDNLMELPGQEMQIDPKNWESYNQNLIDIVNNKGGYTSQWQTVGNDRVMVNDDGTGIGTNENGDSYALSQEEVNSMVKNGVLNTAKSGYVAATGGIGNTPNGSEKAPTTPAKPATSAKPTGTAPKTATSGNPAVAAITNLANQQQQYQNSVLNMMMNDRNEVANIKSFKDLYGDSLFGDTYIPPSALGVATGFAQQPQFQSQDNDVEDFFKGGDVTDINTLLQILRG